jgi:hypothetical protein
LKVSIGYMRRCSATPAHEPATMCCKKLTPLLLSNSSHSSCSSTASAKAEDEDFEEEDEWDILSKKNSVQTEQSKN